MSKTVFFDIDGTLLRTGGAGMVAINETFQEDFQITNQTQVEVRGRTDYGILTDLFTANGLDFDQHYLSFSLAYHQRLAPAMKKTDGLLLPGVKSLLQHLYDSNVKLGIITGNAEGAARIKLQHFGIDHYFPFGGYGDQTSDRNVVAAQAIEAAVRYSGHTIDMAECFVVGDTPADVLCGRSIGAKCVAVLTGGMSEEDFVECPPDELVHNLEARSWL